MKFLHSKPLITSKSNATDIASAGTATKRRNSHNNRTEVKGKTKKNVKMLTTQIKKGKTKKCKDPDCKSERSSENCLKVTKGVGLNSLASKMKELEISATPKPR